VGIAASDAIRGSALFWPALAALPLCLVAARWNGARVAAIAVAGLAAGVARAEWNQAKPTTDVSQFSADSVVRLTGIVLEPPRFFGPESGMFPLELDSVDWTGKVRVQFYRAIPPLSGGDRISIEGRLRPLAPPTNPGMFDRAAWLERLGFGATVTTSKPIEILERGSSIRVSAWMDNARSGLRALLARHARPDVAALQSALLFGSREELPPDLTTALQRSGTAHFLAVSGFNLVLVLVIAWFLLLAVGVRGPAVPGLLLLLLLLYTALTGWQVSVVRAFLMSAAVLGARLFWRRSDVINSLALAALVILAWDPAQLFDTGFQLSFVAVLGIVAIGPVFHEFLAPEPGPDRSRIVSWSGHQVRGAMGVSIGAWLATAPIVLATFNLVTPVILLANLALCPLITILSIVSLATIPLAFVLPPAAGLAGAVATGVFEATAWSAGRLTEVPAAYLFLPALPGWAVAAYYAGLAAWTWRARVRPDRWKPWLCAPFALFMGLGSLFTPAADDDVFGLIDVGRGSCAYAQGPGSGTTIFDCGSLSWRDPGALVAAPALWSLGVSRAHTLVLSHADADHVNGAGSVIERLGIRRLVVPPGFDHPLSATPGIEVIEASRGTVVPGMEILGPPSDAPRTWPVNERSLVVRIGRVLIPGDIEELGTRALLESGLDLRAEILVLPHHGKRQDSHRELIAAVRPRIVLVSAPVGYASREVLDHARGSAVVYQTGLDGWIEVGLDPAGPTVRRYRER
jgi:competence protein ComEC